MKNVTILSNNFSDIDKCNKLFMAITSHHKVIVRAGVKALNSLSLRVNSDIGFINFLPLCCNFLTPEFYKKKAAEKTSHSLITFAKGCQTIQVLQRVGVLSLEGMARFDQEVLAGMAAKVGGLPVIRFCVALGLGSVKKFATVGSSFFGAVGNIQSLIQGESGKEFMNLVNLTGNFGKMYVGYFLPGSNLFLMIAVVTTAIGWFTSLARS